MPRNGRATRPVPIGICLVSSALVGEDAIHHGQSEALASAPAVAPAVAPASPAPAPTPGALDLLRLTLAPGLGPILIRRAVETLGSVRAVLDASPSRLEVVRGLGAVKAREIHRFLRERAGEETAREIDLCGAHGVALLSIFDERYPALLREIADAPPILYVRGGFDPVRHAYPLAIVGSRTATHYGVEQAERFAGALAEAGLTIVSGGARGIDTAAHRAALRLRGQTIAVMGCGLSHCYPPENTDLYDEIIAAGGAVVSELPMRTSPAPENFPARNRLISGMSLGVLVVEAPRRSGALITARLATEEHGREVMCVPGRVDSPASEGSLDLIKQGGAAMVTNPADVLDLLESPARHAHRGSHADRYGGGGPDGGAGGAGAPLDAPAAAPPETTGVPGLAALNLTTPQRAILEALASPCTLDELARRTGLDAGVVRSEATVLEVRRVIVRRGDRLATRTGRS